MIVWLVTVGEPLPTDEGSPRLLRAGILANMMAAEGHEVHWWTSSFDHQLKKQRCEGAAHWPVRPGLWLHLLPGRSYQRNVSLARIGNHRDNAQAFARLAPTAAPRPDLILCSFPTIELCQAAVTYGRENGVPVVVDVRDLWPDVMQELVPAPLRPLARWLLSPMHRASQQVFAGATAVTGITTEFVRWGLQRGGRAEGPQHRAFPMAYVDPPEDDAGLAAARQRWAERGVDGSTRNFVFFGTLGRQFDLSSVIAAARQVQQAGVKFVICGTGDRLAQYQQEAQGCPNVVFAGWVNAAMIQALMRMAAAGLAPYNASDNFDSNIPNKVVEYMAGGLPIVTTLGGVCGGLLAEFDCGLSYRHDDLGALVQAIDMLAADPSRRQAMGRRARALYEDRFDASRVYADMIRHLGALAGPQATQTAAAAGRPAAPEPLEISA